MSNTPAYRKRYGYLRHNGVPTSLVDAGPYRRHLERLGALGWGFHAIEPVTGISDYGMNLIASGVHRTCARSTAAGIMRMPYTLAVPDAVPDEAFVPAEGAVRRVRALMVLGWKRDAMNEHLAVVNIDHLARGTYPVIKAYRWRDVARMYEQLHMTIGDAPLTASRARARAWAPPMAWDCIDDPDERPKGLGNHAADRAADLAELDDLGLGISEVCRRLGISRDALEKWCARKGLGETFARLVGREGKGRAA